MNYSTSVFLINKNVRAVIATYEADSAHTKAPRTTFKTLDQSIKVGDIVTVPSGTRHNVTTAKIVEVDAAIDLDASTKIDWVVSVVDMTGYEKTLAQETQAIDAIKSAEMRKRRDDMLAALVNDREALKALPIAAFNGDHPPK